jgi:hypothetical protein
MRRKTRRVNIAGWADALTGVVIAWNTRGMSTSKREPVEPGPKPVYSLRPARPSQTTAEDPKWDDPHWPFRGDRG